MPVSLSYLVAECDDGHSTVVSLQRQFVNDLADEVLHLCEVVAPNVGGGVDQKYDIRLGAADWQKQAGVICVTKQKLM